MKIQGIDVSKWQGTDIDWNKVKASGIDFVIIRAGIGKAKDVCFDRNYKAATAAGLNVGAYWYSYAMSDAEARAEAAAALFAIAGKQFAMPIYFDVEERNQLSKSMAFVSSIITAFCTEMEKAGYFAGFYMSRSPLQYKVNDETLKRFAVWAAEYNAPLNYHGKYPVGMWQKSDKGKVAGINGNVDLDECYIDYPAIIKNGGFNGFSKGDTATVTDSGNSNTDSVASAPEVQRAEYYTIQKGDTLTAIAKKYNTTVEKLVELNGIKNKNRIYAGTKIKIP